MQSAPLPFNYITWETIPHFYNGQSIVFFFVDHVPMLDFIEQEIGFGHMTQFAIRFGQNKLGNLVPENTTFNIDSYWQLSTQARDYLEQSYA